MMTYSNLNAIPAPGLPTGPIQDGVQIRDGAPLSEFEFNAASLPVIGRDEAKAVGVALSFADDEADACGEDRFELVLISADGRALMRLGPFGEEDVVAQWRDCAAKSGLPRMIVREDGSVAEVSRQIGPLALGRTRQRRRVGLLNGRRPRFLVRRKTARLPARPQIHRGESEIIARS